MICCLLSFLVIIYSSSINHPSRHQPRLQAKLSTPGQGIQSFSDLALPTSCSHLVILVLQEGQMRSDKLATLVLRLVFLWEMASFLPLIQRSLFTNVSKSLFFYSVLSLYTLCALMSVGTSGIRREHLCGADVASRQL